MTTQVHGSDWTSITFLPSAISKGAVCLDGSPPAYYFRKGSGDGIDNWVIFLEGGGWCASNKGCLGENKYQYWSTKLKEKRHYFKDILSSNRTINPDFYNWNRVYVGYCDGSSYTGDVEENTYPTRRGAKIFDVVMEDMLAKGMKNAKNAILSGGSAGAWGAIVHCDGFRKLIPKASRVKCISDSGFFVHAKNLYGAKKREEYFADLIAYHCLFPENIVKDIKTPIFFLESAFDYYQTVAEAISDWYFDRSSFQEIDTQNELPRDCTVL
ncbi:Pectin acetylesterase 11 [Sesamum angolense]|uniref:Pectin acetylesterase n=1 Tax=Sesamum angolense TaxID=2727404 RepID=A0AAE1W6L6_9LAMI|nr:Pectin acetylesterase 11 [Sesamum angolense]